MPSRARHFTADELLEKARSLDAGTSRATLYRTIAMLVEGGLLHEIDLGRGVSSYDPNFIEHPHHNHLICVDCQKVVEFEDQHIEVLEDCITDDLASHRPAKASRSRLAAMNCAAVANAASASSEQTVDRRGIRGYRCRRNYLNYVERSLPKSHRRAAPALRRIDLL